MTTQRKIDDRLNGNGASAVSTSILMIDVPPRHQGVGNALRATYRPMREDVPPDMMALLSQLDMH